MRVVLDTNILVSALLAGTGPPDRIYRAWANGAFTLLSSRLQMRELKEVLRRPALAARIRPYEAGRLVNQLQTMADLMDPLPHVRRSPDPADDFLLATAAAGRADYLVTGDKAGLLALRRHEGTRIISARSFAARLR